MTKKSKEKQVAVIIPVFCEEHGIETFFNSLKEQIAELTHYKWRVLFVDDGSIDNTIEILLNLSKKETLISVISFTRNFGKEAALSAGVREVRQADAVICIDADMQHPPELIREFIELWEKGARQVIGVRKEVEGHSFFRKVMSSFYYFLVKKIGSNFIIEKSTDFRLIDREIIELFIALPTKIHSFRNTIDWLGFESVKIYFEAPRRFNGDARYKISDLFSLAVNSITTFSLMPLKIIGLLGAVVSGTAGSLSIVCIFVNLLKSEWYFTPLALFVIFNTFLAGVIMLFLGLLALYVGNIAEGVLRRPDYIIDKRFGEF